MFKKLKSFQTIWLNFDDNLGGEIEIRYLLYQQLIK